jgi:Nucleotidyl transferase AbiEii toxin, Type IV TA system
MKPVKKYGALRRALEDRLRQTASVQQIDLARLRRQIAFDRLLARLFHSPEALWALKGGYAMELRLRVARTTVDIDLTLPANPNLLSEDAAANVTVREMLQDAASLDFGDWVVYTIGAPTMDLDAAPYGGARYPIECRMDGRIFARFHLDVGIGDVVMQPLETIQGQDWLGFAGVSAAAMRLISKEQQVAEKLHAYTLPRSTPNSRVKDLVDLLLLIRTGDLRQANLAEAVCMTFERRKTHPIPTTLVPPPESWNSQFGGLAAECGLSSGLDEGFAEMKAFFDPLLHSSK